MKAVIKTIEARESNVEMNATLVIGTFDRQINLTALILPRG